MRTFTYRTGVTAGVGATEIRERSPRRAGLPVRFSRASVQFRFFFRFFFLCYDDHNNRGPRRPLVVRGYRRACSCLHVYFGRTFETSRVRCVSSELSVRMYIYIYIPIRYIPIRPRERAAVRATGRPVKIYGDRGGVERERITPKNRREITAVVVDAGRARTSPGERVRSKRVGAGVGGGRGGKNGEKKKMARFQPRGRPATAAAVRITDSDDVRRARTMYIFTRVLYTPRGRTYYVRRTITIYYVRNNAICITTIRYVCVSRVGFERRRTNPTVV